MTCVMLLPYHVQEQDGRDKLIVRYRAYVDGRWHKNGFYTFQMPIHEIDIIERAQIEFPTAQVYLQQAMHVTSDLGMFYP